MGDTMELATLARDSASPLGDSSERVMVEKSHQDSDSKIESSTARVCCTDQSARQYSDPIHLQETSTAHVCCTDQLARLESSAKGVCTCAAVQIASLSQAQSNDPEIPTESEIKDLLLKLITQTKEQQNDINTLRSALKNGLEQLLETVLRQFKGDIEELQKQVSKKDQKSIIDPQQMVKPFSPTGKLSFGDTPVALRTRSKRRPFKFQQDAIQDSEASTSQTTKLQESEPNLRSAEKQYVDKGTEALPVATGKPSNCKAYKVKVLRQDTPSNHDAAESYLSLTPESDQDMSLEESKSFDSAESNIRLSRKKLPRHHPEKAKSRTGRWKQGGVQQTKSQKEKFEPPKESIPVRTKADQRIQEALNQVPDAIHYNHKSKKAVVTLYVGNLDFEANRAGILESLRKHIRNRIQVNELIIANHHGRSKGYGFVTLSWVREAKVDPADICKLFSGMIQVKSRRLYLQELHEDVADKAREKAYTTRNVVQQDSEGGHHLGDGVYCSADGNYLMTWD